MASDVELKKIKKKYGEKFMHMCRELFPTILEQEGALFAILEKTFANNGSSLYEDIHNNGLEEGVKDLIYKIFVEDNSEEEEIVEGRTPYELLDEAGYTLYECRTERDIKKFKKYFAIGEELCTFRGGRLEQCVVFFAVKKNVDKIKRENFDDPKREDEYGTSVMSIQFSKGSLCTVSIKNRYNHTVNNPDATYGNDLDNIIPGLTQSFKKLLEERGMHLDSSNVERMTIPNYVVAGDRRYYKYNLEINGVYFCPGNIVIDYGGKVIKVGEPERKVLIENFVVDLISKTITQYGTCAYKNGIVIDWSYEDSITDDLTDIEKIEILTDKEAKNGERIITIKKKNSKSSIQIRIDKDNSIIGYINTGLRKVGNDFLLHNEKLKELELPQLEQVGDYFLHFNKGLTSLALPSLKKVGDNFIYINRMIDSLEAPNLKIVGNAFLDSNIALKKLQVPNLVETGRDFVYYNTEISDLEAPNLAVAGDYFLWNNRKLRKLVLPKLISAGKGFFQFNSSLKEISLPSLEHTIRTWNAQISAYQKRARSVSYQELSRLDKDSKITDTETNLAKRMLDKERDVASKEK